MDTSSLPSAAGGRWRCWFRAFRGTNPPFLGGCRGGDRDISTIRAGSSRDPSPSEAAQANSSLLTVGMGESGRHSQGTLPKFFHALLGTGAIRCLALRWCCGAVCGRKDASPAQGISWAAAFVLPRQKVTLLVLQFPLKSWRVWEEVPVGLGWNEALLPLGPAPSSARGWVWLWWSQKWVLFYMTCHLDRWAWDLGCGAANSTRI